MALSSLSTLITRFDFFFLTSRVTEAVSVQKGVGNYNALMMQAIIRTHVMKLTNQIKIGVGHCITILKPAWKSILQNQYCREPPRGPSKFFSNLAM